MRYRSFVRLALGLSLSSLLAAAAQADLLGAVRQAAVVGDAVSSASSGNASGGLVSLVGQQLGVTEAQATGGLGAIFSVAQQQLNGEQFSQIAGSVPGIDTLLSAAPKADSGSKLNGLLSQAGQYGKTLQGANYLNSAFKQLGLSPESIAPFVDIAVQYLQSSNPAAASLLKQAVGGV